MISKIQSPKSKAELVKAIQAADIGSVAVYEGGDLSRLPSKADLARRKASVIVLIAK